MSGPNSEHIHVYPTNDLVIHETEGKPCPCGPRIEAGGRIIIHNSWDEREKWEQEVELPHARVRAMSQQNN